jgi:hypothetical protein
MLVDFLAPKFDKFLVSLCVSIKGLFLPPLSLAFPLFFSFQRFPLSFLRVVRDLFNALKMFPLTFG